MENWLNGLSLDRYMETVSTRFLYAVSSLPREEIEKLVRLVEFLASEIHKLPENDET